MQALICIAIKSWEELQISSILKIYPHIDFIISYLREQSHLYFYFSLKEFVYYAILFFIYFSLFMYTFDHIYMFMLIKKIFFFNNLYLFNM